MSTSRNSLAQDAGLTFNFTSSHRWLADTYRSKRLHVSGGWGNWLGQHEHRQPFKSAGHSLIPSHQRLYERDRELLGSALANDHRGRDSLDLFKTVLMNSRAFINSSYKK